MEYVSCEWIERRVVLAIDQLQYCCIPHSGNKGYVKIVPYKGGPLPVDAILEARRSLIEANNTPGVETACTGCHFLQKKDWDAERAHKTKGLFDTVYIGNFTICNLRCRYCFVYINEAEERPDIDYDVLPVFQEMLAQGHLDPQGYVEWGGGEPTILPSFAELQTLLRQHGIRQQIHTSGVRFAPEIEEGLRSGLLQVVTSVDSGTRETYLKVKGRDRHDVVWENVRRYAATGGNMALKYILRHDNSDPENVRQFVQKAKAAGIHKVAITPDMREIAQNTIREETIFAFALLMDEAQRAGIEAQIRDEYLKPEDMLRVTKYHPLALHGWRYKLRLTRRDLARRLELRRRDVRRLENSARTRDAVQRARRTQKRGVGLVHPIELFAPFHQRHAKVAQLLEYQTQNPDPELLSNLREIVRKRLVSGQANKDGRAVVMGVDEQAWTVAGEPAYVLVDAEGLEKPLAQEVWLACYAGARDYPLRVTVSDGEHEPLEYVFLQSERVRMELPSVPAGESRLFAVRTDKTWTWPDSPDPRVRGVHVTTRMRV
jgi:molybdenum cofactor biosynthesis enzyme MoaA